ncbi:MAG: hypothetical protein EA425_01375 [Puniceicoccaceae bacterium]|nr:MAG: hypothetical protein EA425_01375 [Puniceicoccaceae bacterium]
MIRLVQSTWFIACTALVLSLLTQVAVLSLRWDRLVGGESFQEVDPAVEEPLHWNFSNEEVHQLKVELRERLHATRTREAELDEYRQRLQVESAELDQVRANLEAMQAGLSRRIIEAREDEARNLRNLSRTYAAMEPAAAVTIFSELEDETVVKILALMNAETVGNILQEMSRRRDPDNLHVRRAARLSDMIRLYRQTRDEDR